MLLGLFVLLLKQVHSKQLNDVHLDYSFAECQASVLLLVNVLSSNRETSSEVFLMEFVFTFELHVDQKKKDIKRRQIFI